ncbi:MAG: MBL fold metallo-hydrolase RNA specificity domain-containing protein, partial [Opitutaceae bacterium]
VKALVGSGGVALIACFALGRAQEVLSILDAAMSSGALPKFPVWIDGMIDKVNEVYRSHGRLSLGENFHEVRTEGWEREEVVSRIQEQPSVVVATSGMLTGGPMVFYAQQLARQMNVRLFFSGYVDEDSPGGQALRLLGPGGVPAEITVPDDYGVRQTIQVRVAPDRVRLSAHADQNDLVGIIERYEPENVVLVHSEAKAREALTTRLSRGRFRVSADPRSFALS